MDLNTPYTASPNHKGRGKTLRVEGYNIHDATGLIPVAVVHDASMPAFDKALAAEFVNALNSHKALVEALEACKKELGIRDDFVPLGPAVTLAPIINAALELAKEQP